MNIFIITGASKGIGLELMCQLKEKGETVIGIARTNSGHEGFETADLSETSGLAELMNRIIEENLPSANSFTLINNAGTVEPIGLIGSVNDEELVRAMSVNLTAPMILSNAFIGSLKGFEGEKRIINISSGAGRNPYEGWGVYCTTKAGLDHFSRVVSLEQKKAQFPVDIVSIAPGIIDTDMQETIRSSEAEDFPLLDRFIDYKEQGHLSSASETASKLIAVMEREDFKGIGPIADIRQL
ncbi:SDR family NAD(P)-dependent oxidoreductase [Sporosarcina highlanderae]|uniref:SDR family NAD(P)-dependent oxidoreductase n=1 Tax=Sporosarcina highlanderae TaxID=3035916 RepID=A0ABT8JP98_9BACL|nr:SDR family NAD(P)-dependent oxidoreductase [Sporosarcina highlanderae]MDN4606966.1 SDR family NAD(P)-dependent oxidoreductase [Sporosarcina highlanderae]